MASTANPAFDELLQLGPEDLEDDFPHTLEDFLEAEVASITFPESPELPAYDEWSGLDHVLFSSAETQLLEQAASLPPRCQEASPAGPAADDASTNAATKLQRKAAQNRCSDPGSAHHCICCDHFLPSLPAMLRRALPAYHRLLLSSCSQHAVTAGRKAYRKYRERQQRQKEADQRTIKELTARLAALEATEAQQVRPQVAMPLPRSTLLWRRTMRLH